MIEWYVDAIVAYMAIHSKIKIKDQAKLNKKFLISVNSKDAASTRIVEKFDNSLVANYLNRSEKVFNNLFDITTVKGIQIPQNIDIFTYSFPCQDLSIQGKQKGMDQANKTRSGLLWEVKRILEEMKRANGIESMPKYLLLENVKNIVSPKHLINFKKWINNLNDIGYSSKYYVLNAAHFGSCQNRERVFCISVRKDYQTKVDFKFPEFLNEKNNSTINDILEKNPDKKYFKENLNKYKLEDWKSTNKGIIKSKLIGYTSFQSEAYVYDPKGKGPTLTASGANSRIKIICDDNKIRFLTPMENYLYMGFNKTDYLKVKNTHLLSDAKITYTAGNSVSVQVLQIIFKTFKFGD